MRGVRQVMTPREREQWTRLTRHCAALLRMQLIRKLTVSLAMPYYDNKFGDEPENFVVPKLDMVATAERRDGPVTLQFQSPLLRPAGSSQKGP